MPCRGWWDRPFHALIIRRSAGVLMSIWSRIADFILGAKLLSMEQLEELEGKAVAALDDGFTSMNKTIDRNSDGYVSVREAWAMVKVILKTVKTVIGGLRK